MQKPWLPWLIIAVISIASLIWLAKYGDLLNENAIIGCIAIEGLMVLGSGLLFFFGTFRVRKKLLSDSKLKKLFVLSIFGFILSFFHIPIWIILSGQFPPKAFNHPMAEILTLLVAFSLIMPAAPFIVLICKDKQLPQ